MIPSYCESNLPAADLSIWIERPGQAMVTDWERDWFCVWELHPIGA